MPFALVFIGLVMIVTGAKGTNKALGQQLVTDFTGPGNFFYWFASIGVMGALGSIPGFKPFSRAFMALIIIAMVIRNGGVFDKFTEAIKNGPVSPARNSGEAVSAGNAVSQGASSLQETANKAVNSVKEFRETTTPAQSDPWANFGKTLKILSYF